ncbi:MAG TPA: hypothetical protein VK050_02235 [Flavobacteriaceae bacterium]|nr:hypothetical protein [Flavobacteriaceae bacterium]
MREKIYLYLLMFVTVILVFLYKYQSSVFERQHEDNQALERVIDRLEIENKELEASYSEKAYFSLEKNESALSYIEEVYNTRPDSLVKKIENYFYDKNGREDNPLVPYSGMEGTMQVNKVQLLNHKWVLADFTDGTYWGEMVLEYFYNPDDQSIEVELLNSFLYTSR